MEKKDKTSIIRKIIWLPYYDVKTGPKSFKLWWAMFYYVFLVIAIIKLTTSAVHNVWQFLAVVGLVVLIFNFIPYQICLAFSYIFKRSINIFKKSAQKERAPLGFYIFLILIFLIVVMYIDTNFNNHRLMDLYYCRGTPATSSGCYDTGERYEEKWEDIPCLKGHKYGDPMVPNPDYVGPEVKCENQIP